MPLRPDAFASVRLTTDLDLLTAGQRKVLRLLIEAAEMMNPLFWRQAYGDHEALLDAVHDEDVRRFILMNYGPWDRLAGNEPFVEGVGPKPAGAQFYPQDMTREEFERHLSTHPEDADAFKDLHTFIRRDERGSLIAIPYHEANRDTLGVTAEKLREAAACAEDAGLRKYLELRAEALLTDRYRESDFAWLDMRTNTLDIVIGAIETYEDQLFGYKATYESFVLVKDKEWSRRLVRYAALLPDLQRNLPVPDAYRQEPVGADSDLNAYDVVYCAGDCNAGSKTIAINLPNDEEVQLKKGARRLQLKNVMRAKFEKILRPIARVLIAEEQHEHITFDAFFANTMFHEVAHGLGIKNTIDGRGSVREALREHYTAIEEGKADILGLYLVMQLFERGEIPEGSLLDNYVTFVAGIFRSVRFGVSSAHGKANMMRFNYFVREGACSRDERTGRYLVHAERMGDVVRELTNWILMIQGDGDYEGAKAAMSELGAIGPDLQADLDRVAEAGVPLDLVYEQGVDVLEAGE